MVELMVDHAFNYPEIMAADWFILPTKIDFLRPPPDFNTQHKVALPSFLFTRKGQQSRSPSEESTPNGTYQAGWLLRAIKILYNSR